MLPSPVRLNRFVPLIIVGIALAQPADLRAQSLFGGGGTTGVLQNPQTSVMPQLPGAQTGGAPQLGGTGGAGGNALGAMSSGQPLIAQPQATGFVGSAAPGQMVGVQTGTQTGARGAATQGGRGRFQTGGGQTDPNQQFGAVAGQGLTDSQQVRVRPRIAFDVPARPTIAVAGRVESQLTALSTRQPELRGVAVGLDLDGVVTLRGNVPNESARRVAAALVRLEPGVRSVRNELTVGP